LAQELVDRRSATSGREKRLGLHLGFGAELPDFGPRERRTTAHHLDAVLDDARLVPA